MGTWDNADGLHLTFGTDKAIDNKGGEYRNDGQLREIEVKLTLTELTEAETVVSDTIYFPKNVRVQEVEVITHTAAATGVAIDVGLVRASDRTTEIDFNGFLAAFPTAQMDLAGERTIFTSATTVPLTATGTGALIGATSGTFVGHITASRTTATAFTAGVIFVKIKYYTTA